MDLLLEYQNRAFKHFYDNRRSFLQDKDEMIQLYVLIVDALIKMKQIINIIIICQE